MRPKLYKGRPWRGVVPVLTEESYKALLDYREHINEHGSTEGMAQSILQRLAGGMMTFVTSQVYIRPDSDIHHWGTHEMMDALLAMCDVTTVEGRIPLPRFNEGARAAEAYRFLGYGYKRDAFNDIVRQALAAAEEEAHELLAGQ